MENAGNNDDKMAGRDICSLNVHRACSPNLERGAILVSELEFRVVAGTCRLAEYLPTNQSQQAWSLEIRPLYRSLLHEGGEKVLKKQPSHHDCFEPPVSSERKRCLADRYFVKMYEYHWGVARSAHNLHMFLQGGQCHRTENLV